VEEVLWIILRREAEIRRESERWESEGRMCRFEEGGVSRPEEGGSEFVRVDRKCDDVGGADKVETGRRREESSVGMDLFVWKIEWRKDFWNVGLAKRDWKFVSADSFFIRKIPEVSKIARKSKYSEGKE